MSLKNRHRRTNGEYMKKIYVFPGGGQKARQNINTGEFSYKIVESSDWPEKSCAKEYSFEFEKD